MRVAHLLVGVGLEVEGEEEALGVDLAEERGVVDDVVGQPRVRGRHGGGVPRLVALPLGVGRLGQGAPVEGYEEVIGVSGVGGSESQA